MSIPLDAQRAYSTHKAAAAFRGIPFTLTQADWWKLWAPHWRVRKSHKLQMCRTRDMGGYAAGNVRIDTRASNAADRSIESFRTRANYTLALLPGRTLPERLNRLEVRALRRALAACNHNASAAARMLGITFRQMRYALKKHSRLATIHAATSFCDLV